MNPSKNRPHKPSVAPAATTAQRSVTRQRGAGQASPAQPAYHHGNLRAALVEAGLKHLDEHPDTELSLRDLARSVGVTANAAYRHFTDKAALLRAIAAEGFRRFDQVQTKARARHADTADQFKAAGVAYIGFALEHPALFRLMFSSAQVHATDPEIAQASAPTMLALLTSAARQSALTLEDPLTLVNATQAWATVHGLSHLILDGRLQALAPSTDELISAVLDQMTFAAPQRQPATGKKTR